jgi:hypothetical protein
MDNIEQYTTIDITPTREQYAKTLLYIFANHAPKTMRDMLPSYHELTKAQEDMLMQMFAKLENVGKWYEMNKTAKEGLISTVRQESEANPIQYKYTTGKD